MIESTLYECILTKYLKDYRDNERNNNKDNYYCNLVEKSRATLVSILDKEQLDLIDKHIYYRIAQYEEADYNACVMILNLGVKIGMELQKSFDDMPQ